MSNSLWPYGWIVAHQAVLSMGFSRQEYWSGLPCPPPGVLPNPGIKPSPLMSPALAGGLFTISATWEALVMSWYQSLSCVQLCDPMDCSLPVSSVLGLLQARMLQWVAVPFSYNVIKTGKQVAICLSMGLESMQISRYQE